MIAPLWTALLLGVGGSLHCLGMCGPLVVALGQGREHSWASSLLYHGGRLLAYVLIGYTLGLIGWGLSLVVLQQVLSIVAGALLLVLLLVHLRVLPTPPFYRWVEARVRAAFAQANTQGGWRLPLLGFLNGLLPCGLVYVAAAAALSATQWWAGAAWMLAFGLGTLPSMLLVGWLPSWPRLRPLVQRGNRVLPYLGLLLALWMIVRGTGLDAWAASEQPERPAVAAAKSYRCPLCK